MKSLRIVVAFLLFATPAIAQGADSVLWTREVIHSKKLGEARAVFVVTPEAYQWMNTRYPVLVLLDANDWDQFAAARANVAFLSGRGAIPELIVVGIPNGKDRGHDLSPPATGKTITRAPTAGGADAFVDFIADEVLPLVRSKYRALPTTIFAGHSLGGLVAVHVAATRPALFAGIIAMSPSLWWNDSSLVAPYADAIARAPTALRLFASSGGLEPSIDVTTQRFAGRVDSLRPQAVSFTYRRYPKDDHGLTPLHSLMDGLTFVFEPVSQQALPTTATFNTPSWQSDVFSAADSLVMVKAVVESEAQYARGARLLGLPEVLDRGVLEDVGQYAMFLKRPGFARWAFRRNADKYPDWAKGHESLGDALLAAGDSSAAKAEFRLAVDIATRTGHPIVTSSRAKLDKLSAPVQAGKAKP